MIEKERITAKEIRLDAANRALQPRDDREKTYHKYSIPTAILACVLFFGLYNYPTVVLWGLLAMIVAAPAFGIGRILYIKHREKHLNMDLYEVKTLAVTALIYEEYEIPQRSGNVYIARNYVLRFEGDLEWLIPATTYLWSEKWRRVARLLYEDTARDDLFYVVLNKKTGKILVAYPTKWFVYCPEI